MDSRVLSAVCLCLAFVVGGCVPQSRNSEPLPAKTFVPFAEGVTAAGDHEDPEIAGLNRLRDSGAYPAPPADALVVHPRRLEIKVGEVFSLKKLIITALDSNGKPLRRIPFSVEREAAEPPLVEMQAEHPELFRALRPGKIDLRFVSRAARPDGSRPPAYVTFYIRP